MNTASNSKTASTMTRILYAFLGIAASLACNLAANQVFNHYQDWQAFSVSVLIYVLATLGLGAAFSIAALFLSRANKPEWSFRLYFLGLGSVYGFLTIPFIDMAGRKLQETVYFEPRFDEFCKKAHATIVDTGDKVSGVLYSLQTDWRDQSEFLLNQSALDYIERRSTSGTAMQSAPKYERVEVVGERIRFANPVGFSPGTMYRVTQLSEPAAPYEITQWGPTHVGTGGEQMVENKVELRRRSDNTILASANSYWHVRLGKGCPEGTGSDDVYMLNFLLKVLAARK